MTLTSESEFDNRVQRSRNASRPKTPSKSPTRRSTSEGVDAQALAAALKDAAATPTPSPSRKRQRTYGDRWVIPSRDDCFSCWRVAVMVFAGNFAIACKFLTGNEKLMFVKTRFIPNRDNIDLQASFNLLHADGSPSTPSKPKKRTPHGELHFQKSMRHVL